ncbi:CpsD/CapB family tyrosine-protein kinase, partial [Thermodesulfobacteriota bacterium]
IRTAILFSFETAPQFILVTSAGPSEGKTVCAANLAVTMAQAGSKVLLIDCDMRRPRLHKIFGTSRDSGVSGVITGQDKLNDVIFSSGVNNLHILPVGPIPPNPSEILGSRNMASFIEVLRKKYTRIIVDSPPLTAVTDSVVLAKAADGVLLVIRAADTPRQIVKNGITQLHSVHANIMGAVLNGVNTGRDGYHYQYYYYYYGEDDPDKKKKSKRNKKHSKTKSK